MTVFDEKKAYTVDMGRFMQDIFHSGTNYITDGVRGGGKTHTALAFAWGLVNGIWPECGKVVLLTNIIFLKRIKKTPGCPDSDFIGSELPEGVYRVFTLEDIFRTISNIWGEHPKRDTLFLIVLDEAQNFFNSYDARSPVSSALQKWFGTLRKFDTCLWMMTPSKENVPPKGRYFIDDVKYSGYLSGIWSKNKKLTLEYMMANHLDVSGGEKATRQWTILRLTHEDPIKRFLHVPVTPWNKPREQLEVGEFTYDHVSSADFSMGSEGFDFEELLNRCSKVSSLEMPAALAEYFQLLDNGMLDDENSSGREGASSSAVNRQRALDKFLMLKEMDKIGLSERKEAQIFSMPKSTFRRLKQNLYDSFAKDYLSDEEREEIERANSKKKGPKAKKIEDFDEQVVDSDIPEEEETVEVEDEEAQYDEDQ